MKINDVSDLYKRIFIKHGEENQIIIAIEEMTELSKELCKYLRTDADVAMSRLAEEMAHVEICMEQLRHIFDIGYMVDKAKDKKLEKLDHLMNAK